MIARFFSSLLAVTLTTGALAQQPAPAPAAESATQGALNDARELFQAGKWLSALDLFQKFQQQYKFSGGVPVAIFYEASCLVNLKRYPEAINTFDRLFKTYPNAGILPEATLKQAEAYRELGNLAKALEQYRAFLQRYPKHELTGAAMMGQAWTLYKQKNYPAATQFLQQIRSTFAGDPSIALDAGFLLGQVFTDAKQFDAARELYKQIAGSRDPRATEGLFLAAQAMFDEKRFPEAIAYFKRVQSKPGLIAGISEQIDGLRAEIAARLRAGQNAGTLQAKIEELRQLATDIQGRPDFRAVALFRTANCYQALGKPEEAAIVYRQFLRLYANDALAEKAHYGLIQSLTEARRLAQADVESKAFERLYPKSALSTDALFMSAETLFGTGQYNESIERYRKFLTTGKDARLIETAEFRIASALYGLKQYAAARDAFSTFTRKYPQSKLAPDALFGLGRTYFELSRATEDPKIAQPDLQDAANTFEQIRRTFPQAENLPDVTFQLGYLYSYLNAYDKSVVAFQEFVTKWPAYKNREGKLLAPEASYQLARSLAATGKVDDAVAAYRQLAERWPDNELAPFGAYEIAGVYADAKRPADMIAAYRAYAEKYPRHARVGDALYAIAQQLEAEKKPDDAIAAYRQLVERAASFGAELPDDVRNAAVAGQLRVAGILEQRGSLDNAVADCETFTKKFAADPVAVRSMTSQIGQMYRRAKRAADGFAKLDQIVSQNLQSPVIRVAATSSTIELALSEKDYPRAYAGALKLLADPERDRLPALSYVAIGNAMLRTDRFNEARDAFEKTIAAPAADARIAPLAQLGLGQAQLALNQLDKAEAAFQQMLQADPQSPVRPEAELGLAKVLEAKGRVDEAVPIYNKVLEASRGEAGFESAYRLGNIALGRTNYKVALAYYARLLFAGGPMAEEGAFRSAQCHAGLGNPEGARSAYQAYLRRYPSGRFAKEAQEKLAALPAPAPAPQ